MLKQGCFIIFLVLVTVHLVACMGGLWTGASLVYDRHQVYKQLNDYQIALDASNALYKDKYFKSPDCVTDLAVFNGDLLLIGHVPSTAFLEESRARLATVQGYRRLFNELIVDNRTYSTAQDSWITGKIRTHIFADGSIDPKAFKIVTADSIVYLMGDVRPEQAQKVINISRKTAGVRRVVRVMKYYTYQTR